MREKKLAIIVAAGRGSRLNDIAESNSLPKQYKMLGSACVLEKSIEAFASHPQIDSVLVVIHRDDSATYDELISKRDKLLPPVIGGASRQESVHLGLKAAKELGFEYEVLIHDAARPFVDANTIDNILLAIAPQTGAIPAHPLADTLKQATGKLATSELTIDKTIARENLYCAQTPQGFMLLDILGVHEKAANDDDANFTDDASLFEAASMAVKLIAAPTSNFKITTAQDLELALMIEQQGKAGNMHADVRTGNGYDVHAFEAGNGVILCGLKIPFHKKLKGHSDADVALHALTDALLGTIGAGDIGTHFPPSDPQWKNADSDQFLEKAISLISDQGGIINNVDITLICEAPKIGPHRIEMQNKLAQLCNLEISRVSVKATTNEKLGFLGREEGIAAIATATISFGTRALSA